MARSKLWRGHIMFDCPACGNSHMVAVKGETTKTPHWEWNGDLERPTLSPSLLVRWTEGEAYEPRVCHSFVRDGRIQFLSDCTHKLAGQTVDLPEQE